MLYYRYLSALLLVSLSECSGRVSIEKECSNTTRTRYVINSYILPTGPNADQYQTDIDGDGAKELNLFSKFTTTLTRNDLNFQSQLNPSVAVGKGVALIDIDANDREDCARLTWTPAAVPEAAPLYDGTDRWPALPGYSGSPLRARGTLDRLQTSSPLEAVGRTAKKIDLFLSLRVATIHYEIFGPQVTITRQSDGTLLGKLTGVIKKQNIDAMYFPTFAKEFTYVINHENADSKIVGGIKELEGIQIPESVKKCMISQDCCNVDFKTCLVHPKEMALSLMLLPEGLLEPDVQVFHGNLWQPVPAGMEKDALSFGLGFTAVPALAVDNCPAGAACQDPGLANTTNWRALWASSASDVWVAGEQGRIFHFDGLTWQAEPSPTTSHINTFWGFRYDDVWAGGDGGTVLHWNGLHWEKSTIGASLEIRDLWGSDGMNLWAAAKSYTGSSGRMLKFDGTRWSEVMVFDPEAINAVYGFSNNNVWFVGDVHTFGEGSLSHMFDGAKWNRMNLMATADFKGLWGDSVDRLLTVGSNGKCLQFNGSQWQQLKCKTDKNLAGVWGSGAGDTWIVGNESTIIRRPSADNPDDWTPILTGSNGQNSKVNLQAVHGSSPADVWMAGAGGALLRYQPTVSE